MFRWEEFGICKVFNSWVVDVWGEEEEGLRGS